MPHCGEPHPFALNGGQVKGPCGAQIKSPAYGREWFTAKYSMFPVVKG
jgi:hypothetical protein